VAHGFAERLQDGHHLLYVHGGAGTTRAWNWMTLPPEPVTLGLHTVLPAWLLGHD
jgi:hypothetical protein